MYLYYSMANVIKIETGYDAASLQGPCYDKDNNSPIMHLERNLMMTRMKTPRQRFTISSIITLVALDQGLVSPGMKRRTFAKTFWGFLAEQSVEVPPILGKRPSISKEALLVIKWLVEQHQSLCGKI